MTDLTFPAPVKLFKQYGYRWTRSTEMLAHVSSIIKDSQELKGWLSSQGVYNMNDRDSSIPATSRDTSTMLAMVYGAFHNPLVLSGHCSVGDALFFTNWKLTVLETLQCPEAVMLDFAMDASPKIRMKVASLPNLSLNVQTLMLHDPDINVRRAFANNEHISEEMKIMAALS